MSSKTNPLRNIGWFALIFLVVILLYPLSLNVATLRSDLMKVDREILATQKHINYLQAELKTRANLQQLEEWNELLYGFKAPTAAQFADGDRALANLGKKPLKIRPVLVSVNSLNNGEEPSGVIGSPFAPLNPVKSEKTIKTKSIEGSSSDKNAAPKKAESIDDLLELIDQIKVAQKNEGNEGKLNRP